MNITTLRKLAVVKLMLCVALCSAVACTPEQQLLLTAADKIISEMKGDDEKDIVNENTDEGTAVLASESDDSSAINGNK